MRYNQRMFKILHNPDATRNELAEYGIWVDSKDNRWLVQFLPTPYLRNILKYANGRIRQYILGELDYRSDKLGE